MARDISSRLRLCGTLVAQSPLHVGGLGEDVDTDLPLARDGAGQLYIPGTSLAGALRELAEQMFGESAVDRLWGYQHEDRGHASYVLVEDAVIANGDAVIVEIHDHIGIDREYGAAAEHIKYDRAILPRGTRLPLCLTVEVAMSDGRNQALAMLASLQQAMEAGAVRLGAAKTRGLGHVKLVDAQLTEQVFGTRQGILDSLTQANGAVVPPEEIEAARQDHPLQKRPRLTMRIDWKPVGPLMVKAGFDGVAADMLPLVNGWDGKVSLVLPGSSIKGAFRFHAERIVRTVLGQQDPDWRRAKGRQKFLDAVDVQLINELFGRRGEKVDPHHQRSWLPGLGALGVMDCYGKQHLTGDQWQAIQSAANDRALQRALNDAGLQFWSQAYHVAIDRWLGSAAESMLYTVLEPHGTTWEPLNLELNLLRLPSELQLPALALLLLVMRDLANDRLPLGFATHRGMGTVCVENVDIRGVDLPASLQGFTALTLQNGRISDVPADLRRDLNSAWQLWIYQNQ
jgi:CRISPR/Cas system CSM-associated protein Csm3 (group 7 of RAMP superfamily)